MTFSKKLDIFYAIASYKINCKIAITSITIDSVYFSTN